MCSIYTFLAGPMLKFVFSWFIILSIWNILRVVILVSKREFFIKKHFDIIYSFRSVFRWFFYPFSVSRWKQDPVFTIITFSFHLCCIFLPFFTLAHVVLIEENFNFSWKTIPDNVSLFMSMIVIFCISFFFLRRIVNSTIRYLSNNYDFYILIVISGPFITGLLSRYFTTYYDFLLVIHVLSGEILLFLIPITYLRHMLFFPLTRGYIGSEFGKVRKIKDW